MKLIMYRSALDRSLHHFSACRYIQIGFYQGRTYEFIEGVRERLFIQISRDRGSEDLFLEINNVNAK